MEKIRDTQAPSTGNNRRADASSNCESLRSGYGVSGLKPRMADSASSLSLSIATLSGSERLLVLTPGPNGASILQTALKALASHPCTVLDSSAAKLATRSNGASRSVLGRATRLPFRRHSFDAILSFESLYSIRPPWTVLAEFHRVLAPDGKLLLLEPSSQGFFSALRDKVSGPGKRIFTLEEIKYRLARSDYEIRKIDEGRVSDIPHPVYCVCAIKKENPAEPVPQFMTAKEMIERRKQKIPKGEELP
jgi:ubiquinone/menaquinone biosynthesis C-methylase UbiE